MAFHTQEGAYPPRGLTLEYRSPCPPHLAALCFNELYGKGGNCNRTGTRPRTAMAGGATESEIALRNDSDKITIVSRAK